MPVSKENFQKEAARVKGRKIRHGVTSFLFYPFELFTDARLWPLWSPEALFFWSVYHDEPLIPNNFTSENALALLRILGSVESFGDPNINPSVEEKAVFFQKLLDLFKDNSQLCTEWINAISNSGHEQSQEFMRFLAVDPEFLIKWLNSLLEKGYKINATLIPPCNSRQFSFEELVAILKTENMSLFNALLKKGWIDVNVSDENGFGIVHYLLTYDQWENEDFPEDISNILMSQEIIGNFDFEHCINKPQEYEIFIFNLLFDYLDKDKVPEALDKIWDKCPTRWQMAIKAALALDSPKAKAMLEFLFNQYNENPKSVQDSLLESYDSNTPPQLSNTSDNIFLGAAIDRDRLDVAKFLLDHGSDINGQDKSGKTLLHHAVQTQNTKMIRTLLAYDQIDINLKDKDGNTALHYAAQQGNLEILKILISDEKITLDVQNNEGKTPLLIAHKNGHKECKETLEEKGADRSIKDQGGNSVRRRDKVSRAMTGFFSRNPTQVPQSSSCSSINITRRSLKRGEH